MRTLGEECVMTRNFFLNLHCSLIMSEVREKVLCVAADWYELLHHMNNLCEAVTE